jgi:hypothetical protein
MILYFRCCCTAKKGEDNWSTGDDYSDKRVKRKKKKKPKGKKAKDVSSDSESSRHGGMHVTRKPPSSSQDAASKDRALIDTFKSVLSEGYLVTLHRAQGKPKTVRIRIEEQTPNILRWSMTKSITRRQYTLDLRDLESVALGGGHFTRDENDPAGAVDESRCFSLVTPTSTLDIETSSKMERDAMSQGFTMLSDDVRARKDEPSQSSIERVYGAV